MKINHIALWAENLDALKEFYCRWFGAEAGEKYHNPRKRFTSYFLKFPDGGASLEIMNVPEIQGRFKEGVTPGYCHMSVSLGSRGSVDALTERMRQAGVTILGEPRTTGDGFYESVVADPEGNPIELTV